MKIVLASHHIDWLNFYFYYVFFLVQMLSLSPVLFMLICFVRLVPADGFWFCLNIFVVAKIL